MPAAKRNRSELNFAKAVIRCRNRRRCTQQQLEVKGLIRIARIATVVGNCIVHMDRISP